MYPNYNNYYPQTPMRQPMAPVGLKGRPVSSLEEVRAASIDFDGSVFYFPDLANRKIYTKHINMDGTASLNIYELKELPVVPIGIATASADYVKREEFEEALRKIQEMLTVKPEIKEEQAISSTKTVEAPTYLF